jgi:hypothetical protein
LLRVQVTQEGVIVENISDLDLTIMIHGEPLFIAANTTERK